MKQNSQSVFDAPSQTSQLSKCVSQNAYRRLDATEQMAEHQRIVKTLEQKLHRHLSWSLDQVRTRGDAQPSLSDSNRVIPDIWVEKLSSNPVLTKQVAGTVLVVAVIDHLEGKGKQDAAKACLEIEGLQELVLINIRDSSLELFTRNVDGWVTRIYKGKEVVSLTTVDFELNMADLWKAEIFSSNVGRQPKSASFIPSHKSKSKLPAKNIDKQLPYRPEFKKLESGRGYLIRLTDELAYQSPIRITNLVGAKVKGIDNEGALDRLAHLLRHSRYKFKHHFYPAVEETENFNKRMYFGHCISAYHLNLQNPRVCTACLADEQICMAQWDINLVTVCPYHGCELIDLCPICNKPLVWHRSSIEKCQCGFNLSEGQLKSARPLTLDVTKTIYRAIEAADDERYLPIDLPHGLQSLPLPSLLKVIQLLGTTFNSELKRESRQIYSRNNLQQGRNIIETAGLVLSSWPNNFHEKLRKIKDSYSTEDIRKKNLISVFGSFYRSLYQEFKEKEFDFLRFAFEEFLNKEWTGLYRSGSMSNCSTNICSQWLTLNQASNLIDGIGGKGLHKLYEEGVIKGFAEKSGVTSKVTHWLERTSLEEHIAGLNQWMPRNVAESLLGLNIKALIALGDAGIYKCQKGRVTSSERRSWLFEAEIVRKIFDTFKKNDVPIVNYENPTKSQIALQHALPNFLGSNKGLPKVIKAVLNGKLAPIARAGKFIGIKDYIFDTQQLRAYRPVKSSRGVVQFLSMRELVDQLGIHQSYAIALVRGGYLGPLAKCESTSEKSISVKYLRLFKKKYIFTKDIASRCGTTTEWIVEYLRSLGLKVKVLKLNNGSNTYLCTKMQLAGIEIPVTKDKRLIKFKEWISSDQFDKSRWSTLANGKST